MPGDEPPKKRGNPAWVKGKSANPGGRPKNATEVRHYLTEKSQRAAEILVELMEHAEDEKVRLAAGKLVLEWSIGKPATIDPNGEVVRDDVIQVVVPNYEPKDKP